MQLGQKTSLRHYVQFEVGIANLSQLQDKLPKTKIEMPTLYDIEKFVEETRGERAINGVKKGGHVSVLGLSIHILPWALLYIFPVFSWGRDGAECPFKFHWCEWISFLGIENSLITMSIKSK